MRPSSDCVTDFLQAWLLLVLHGADMHGTEDLISDQHALAALFICPLTITTSVLCMLVWYDCLDPLTLSDTIHVRHCTVHLSTCAVA